MERYYRIGQKESPDSFFSTNETVSKAKVIEEAIEESIEVWQEPYDFVGMIDNLHIG